MRSNCPLDYVTVTRIGNTVLKVNGYCDPDARETAEDKLVRIIKAEAARARQGNSGRGRTQFKSAGSRFRRPTPPPRRTVYKKENNIAKNYIYKYVYIPKNGYFFAASVSIAQSDRDCNTIFQKIFSIQRTGQKVSNTSQKVYYLKQIWHESSKTERG